MARTGQIAVTVKDVPEVVRHIAELEAERDRYKMVLEEAATCTKCWYCRERAETGP